MVRKTRGHCVHWCLLGYMSECEYIDCFSCMIALLQYLILKGCVYIAYFLLL